MRRARKFQSAVHCAASSFSAPIGADLSPSHMDSDEEAGTAASLDHIIARLQALETADQVRNASDLPVVINVRSGVVHRVVGDPSNPTARQTRCGFRFGGLNLYVRFADSPESRWIAEFVCAGLSHAQPIHRSPSCAGVSGGSYIGALAPLQSHSWPKTRKRVGRVGRQIV